MVKEPFLLAGDAMRMPAAVTALPVVVLLRAGMVIVVIAVSAVWFPSTLMRGRQTGRTEVAPWTERWGRRSRP